MQAFDLAPMKQYQGWVHVVWPSKEAPDNAALKALAKRLVQSDRVAGVAKHPVKFGSKRYLVTFIQVKFRKSLGRAVVTQALNEGGLNTDYGLAKEIVYDPAEAEILAGVVEVRKRGPKKKRGTANDAEVR